jgi:hypothetical protein
MIFYHGKARWRHPLQFASSFRVPAALKPYIPDFAAFLIEPGYIDISRAGGNSFYQAAMLVFKYAFRRPQKHLKTILTTAYGAASDGRCLTRIRLSCRLVHLRAKAIRGNPHCPPAYTTHIRIISSRKADKTEIKEYNNC